MMMMMMMNEGLSFLFQLSFSKWEISFFEVGVSFVGGFCFGTFYLV